jgi:UDP-N-acetylglucosamine--dolichyl-phosphate N-acetylglucosaminephosphotransferase
MIYILLLCALVSFLVVWIITPWLIRYLRKINLVVKDLNKKDTPLVPISGGLAVLSGLFAGLMIFIFFRVFISDAGKEFIPNNTSLLILFASITSILIISFVGFIDDLIIKRSYEESSGLKQWQKPLLTLTAAIPLMVINAGTTTMVIPLVGRVNIGLLYPLFLVPVGVVIAANMVNMLAGFNGMETGMGIVYTGMLGLYAYVNQSYTASLITILVFAALIAFYYYNKYPAKILPGDSLTYLLGAIIACVAIVGNIERAALIASIPFICEFFLKLRSRFKAQSYGYYKEGKIMSKYDKKVYSLTHLFTRTGKFTEKQITYFMILIELIFASLIWLV